MLTNRKKSSIITVKKLCVRATRWFTCAVRGTSLYCIWRGDAVWISRERLCKFSPCCLFNQHLFRSSGRGNKHGFLWHNGAQTHLCVSGTVLLWKFRIPLTGFSSRPEGGSSRPVAIVNHVKGTRRDWAVLRTAPFSRDAGRFDVKSVAGRQ